jgi:hypothetical protein
MEMFLKFLIDVITVPLAWLALALNPWRAYWILAFYYDQFGWDDDEDYWCVGMVLFESFQTFLPSCIWRWSRMRHRYIPAGYTGTPARGWNGLSVAIELHPTHESGHTRHLSLKTRSSVTTMPTSVVSYAGLRKGVLWPWGAARHLRSAFFSQACFSLLDLVAIPLGACPPLPCPQIVTGRIG